MKSREEINLLNKIFFEKFGLDLSKSIGNTPTWFASKLGVVSASNAAKAVAGKNTAARSTYLAELVGQVATGLHAEINTAAMDWGHQYEDAARAEYEFTTGNKVEEVGFIFKDEDFRVGVSLDGLIENQNKSIEIKCPYNTKNYIDFLINGYTKKEYQWQKQFHLWVMDFEEGDFCQYDPRMPTKKLHIVNVKKDNEYFDAFEEKIPILIKDMDEMLASIGIEFGQQWKNIAPLINESNQAEAS